MHFVVVSYRHQQLALIFCWFSTKLNVKNKVRSYLLIFNKVFFVTFVELKYISDFIVFLFYHISLYLLPFHLSIFNAYSDNFGTLIPYLCVHCQYLDLSLDIIVSRFFKLSGIHQVKADLWYILSPFLYKIVINSATALETDI